MFVERSILYGLTVCTCLLFFFVYHFNAKYELQPILTLGLLNASLGAISDLLAQALDSYKSMEFQKKRDITLEKYGNSILLPARTAKLDFHRTIRYAAYGLCFTPIQYHWFASLKNLVQGENEFFCNLFRVAIDQLLFAPLGLGFFFFFMGITECKSADKIKAFFKKNYVPTLKANYILWPAAQFINFTFIPFVFQVLFVNAIAMIWTSYLSLKNSSSNVSLHD
ncbi:Mvp17/PMP22 family protein 2 [Schizosaccharomyces cryophilus OY26]|uniref:Mvp17/PMP22 family protein 2 n=1 Tax=Schizosaccharomyces cryophilus (strain OY26 / ATCC MYA-4695 / CBS 11777 / NBRC 106824 / NRRL Y48691) TaxID=653667 RepID=S9X3X6_SCHCR|nr:Mvp17/PMP22 family protein 2 [Schizosaccharomyces cryophilus OY26]EPY51812.1 Mvp17/PMP22 family protein 2 [Schizosaccharomyces cryophilus OY26]